MTNQNPSKFVFKKSISFKPDNAQTYKTQMRAHMHRNVLRVYRFFYQFRRRRLFEQRWRIESRITVVKNKKDNWRTIWRQRHRVSYFVWLAARSDVEVCPEGFLVPVFDGDADWYATGAWTKHKCITRAVLIRDICVGNCMTIWRRVKWCAHFYSLVALRFRLASG